MELNKDQLSLVRRYPLETLVIFLMMAVCGFYYWLNKLDSKVDVLNVKVETYLKEDHTKMIHVIEQNTEAYNRFQDKSHHAIPQGQSE